MMTVEMRVNGEIVAVIHAMNRRSIGVAPVKCVYEWTGAEWPIELDAPPRSAHGKLEHYRDDGIVRLVEKLAKAFNGT
jgi:hypothetical protein